MTELDPIRFKDNLGATLARYITTAAAVSSARAPRLSRAVADACARAALVHLSSRSSWDIAVLQRPWVCLVCAWRPINQVH